MQKENLESLQTEKICDRSGRDISAQKRWCVREHQSPILSSFVLQLILLVQDQERRHTWMTGGIYPSPPCTTNMDRQNSESEWGGAGWQSHQRQWNIRGVHRVFVQYKKLIIMLVGSLEEYSSKILLFILSSIKNMSSGAVSAPSLDFNYKSLNLNQFRSGQQILYS